MHIPRLIAGVIAATALSAAGVSAWPGVAFAAGGPLWVSSSPTVSGHGTSCSAPGFNTISAAISAAPSGATINVCQGTYREQLQLTSPVTITGMGKAVVKLPASPANSTTACDTANGTQSFQPDQDGVAVCGTGTFRLQNLRIDAAWSSATCDDSLYGLLIGGGATVYFTNSAITAAGARPLNGCQGGIGIQDGMAWTTPVEVGHLFLTSSSVSGYQKNGITADGLGSTANITKATVKGIGATPAIAQNGIQVSNGAMASVSHSTISGNECDVAVCGPDGLTQTQSACLLFYGAAPGSTVNTSVIRGNDIGVYYSANPSGPKPTGPQLTVVDDTLRGNRYEAVQLDQGRASVTRCKISSGNVGIEIIQYSGQTFGSRSVASYDTITRMNAASVQVLSDKAAHGDIRGSFVITRSTISSARVLDNSANLPIVRKLDH